MKTLITTLGFNTDHAVAFLLKEGFEKSDRIVILRPVERTDEDRGEKAFQEIESLTRKLSPEVRVDKVELDTRDFEGMVRKIAEVFHKTDTTITVNISGGVRSIIVAFTIVCTIFGNKIKNSYNYSPITRETKCIDIPYFSCELRKLEREFLTNVVEKGPLDYNRIMNILNISKSSVSRIGSTLKERGLLKITTDGRKNVATSTLTGELVYMSH